MAYGKRKYGEVRFNLNVVKNITETEMNNATVVIKVGKGISSLKRNNGNRMLHSKEATKKKTAVFCNLYSDFEDKTVQNNIYEAIARRISPTK